MSRLSRIAAISALLVCAGCYRMAPIPGTAQNVGTPVRVQLTDQASIDLAALIGPTVVAVDGRLVAATDSALTISLTNAVARNGSEASWSGERIVIPRASVSHVSERAFDQRRSWLFGVGGIAATLAVGTAFNLIGGGNGGGKNPGQNGGPH